VVKPEGILASNTSSISITRIAAATQRPEQVVRAMLHHALLLLASDGPHVRHGHAGCRMPLGMPCGAVSLRTIKLLTVSAGRHLLPRAPSRLHTAGAGATPVMPEPHSA